MTGLLTSLLANVLANVAQRPRILAGVQLYTRLLGAPDQPEATSRGTTGEQGSPRPQHETSTHPQHEASSPQRVLRRLAARARRYGLAPPAALTGDWFGSRAVLAPTVSIHPVHADQAFSTLDDLPAPTPPNPPSTTGEAVGGGWIGYLGYGLSDPRPHRRPEAAWGWADHVLRLDTAGRWWFEALRAEEPPPELVRELAALVAGGDEPAERSRRAANGQAANGQAGSRQAGRWHMGPVAAPDADRHRKAVRRCRDEIAAGEIYQANICSRFSLSFSGDPLEVFAVGSERFRPARAAYLAGGWGAVASLSPELFLARHGQVVRSCPIKGTLPRRGPNDDRNAELLRQSTKDSAENVMIVDMVRNDLGRMAEPGTVSVPQLLDVQAHPGVWHLVSEVRADIPHNAANSELLRATFPPASVTGAPKVRALEVIEELEHERRDVYCGAIGMASPMAGFELNVAIRTLEFDGVTDENRTKHGENGERRELRFGVGGGITADSVPDAEWQECLTKAAPLRSLLGTDGPDPDCSDPDCSDLGRA